ncbi:transporter substrate-binding domain-containing protein (plasmid) [Paroceanicella profunda]|uniref:Transporter substrate-binding domain-containing protein n=1 Tax=Paroceanicella profunda TaxID=2579971 RepID=A0A5B8FIV6_9RHOB|nr:transporter substrate-binding domain-containing protein [Paroceanicella profunda]QDL94251.1 transporter substrate-binding domain-containing protein [Paroceanicella profunda]
MQPLPGGVVALSEQERAWVAAHPVISVANTMDWAPFNATISGRPEGMSVELMSLIASRLGVRLRFVNGLPWGEMMTGFLRGEIDVMPAVYRTPERDALMDFTSAYVYNPPALALRAEDSAIRRLDQLAGRRVGVVSGSALLDLVRRTRPGLEIVPLQSVTSGFEELVDGTIDALLDTAGTIGHLLDTGPANGLVMHLDDTLRGVADMHLRIGVLRGNPVLLGLLQKGLDTVTPQERFALVRRWLPDLGMREESYLGALDLTPAERAFVQAHPRLRFSARFNLIPVEFTDADGTHAGIVSDILSRVSASTGLMLEMTPDRNFAEQVAALTAGETDFISAAQPGPETDRLLDFTRPYLTAPVVLLTRTNAPFLRDIDGLQGLRVGVVYGSPVHDQVERSHPGLALESAPDMTTLLTALSDGGIDVAIANLMMAGHALDELDLGNVKVASSTGFTTSYAMAVRKGDTVLRDVLQTAIDAIDPRDMDSFRNRWAALRLETGPDIRTVLAWGVPVTGAVVALLIVVVLWNRRLRREMRERRVAELRITEQALELERQRNLLQVVMDAMTVGVVAFDRGLRLITWNRKFVEIRGYPEDMLREGMPFEALLRYDVEHDEFGPGDPERLFAERLERMRSFKISAMERPRPDGRFIEIRGSPLAGGGVVTIVTDTTERKRSEQSLGRALEENRRQSERLRGLADNLPAMVFQFGAGPRGEVVFTYCSANMRRMFAMDRPGEAPSTAAFFERVLPGDNARVRAALQGALDTRQGALALAFGIRAPDGTERWLDASMRAYELPGGGRHWDGLILDVTDRRRAEDTLRSSEAMLKTILAASPLGATMMRPDGRLEYFNPRLAEMLGVAPDRLEQASLGAFFLDDARRQDLFARLARHGRTDALHLALRHARGTRVDTLFTCRENPSGEGFIGWLDDITERLATEARLGEKMEELERFSRMAVGREMRMIALKAEVNALRAELARPAAYEIAE